MATRPAPGTLRRAVALVAAAALAQCDDGDPSGPGVVVSAPAPSATGTDGTDGAEGVARVVLQAQVRVEQGLAVEVTYPAGADGRVDPTGAPWPAVVFVQGGFVELSRYHWLADHLASRGYVVIAPEHVDDLAFFETDNATLALRAVRDAAARTTGLLAGAIAPDGRVAVMGHSLGGVVAIRQWISGPFAAVALFASYPAQGDPVTSRAGSPVLSLVGQNDVVKSPAQAYVDGFEAFASPRLFARIDGMDHYAWTDGASAGDLAGDGPETRPVPDVRRDALRILDLWLDASVRQDAAAQTALDAATSFPGATLVMR